MLTAFWNEFKSAVKRSGKSGQHRGGPPWLNSGAPGTPLVGAWTDSRIEQVRHFKHWVYVAIDRRAQAVAQTLPNVSIARDTTRVDGLGTPKNWYPPLVRNKALVPLQLHEELEPVGTDHPLVKLLKDANPYDTGFDLWYETVMYLDLTGSAYWWAPQNRAGLPTELWCVPSHWVWPLPGKSQTIESYQIRPVEGVFTGVTVPAEDMMHFRKKSPVSKIDGYSTLTAVNQWVDAAESVDKTRWHVFKNGPMPQLKVEFAEVNPSAEMLDRLEAKIMNRYGGENRAGRPMLLPKGTTVAPIWMTPKELDFGKSFEQLRDSILASFGVPAVVAGVTKSMTYGSVLAAQAGFCRFAINPLLAFLGQSITEKLAQRYDDKLRVWWPDQTPDDPSVREKELATDIMAGAITVNEIRATRGRKPHQDSKANDLIPGLNAGAQAHAEAGAARAAKAMRRAWQRDLSQPTEPPAMEG